MASKQHPVAQPQLDTTTMNPGNEDSVVMTICTHYVLRVSMCNHKLIIKPLIQTANLLKHKSYKLSDLTPMNV